MEKKPAVSRRSTLRALGGLAFLGSASALSGCSSPAPSAEFVPLIREDEVTRTSTYLQTAQSLEFSPSAQQRVTLSVPYQETELEISAGPAILADSHTIVPITFRTETEQQHFLGAYFNDNEGSYANSLRGIRLLDLHQGRTWKELETSVVSSIAVSSSSPLTIYPIFGAAKGIEEAAICLPYFGILYGIPTTSPEGVLDVETLLAAAVLDETEAASVEISGERKLQQTSGNPEFSGKGSAGVAVEEWDRKLHLQIPQVTRVGKYLVGTLEVSHDSDTSVIRYLNESDVDRWYKSVFGGTITLLYNGYRYRLADYPTTSVDGKFLPLVVECGSYKRKTSGKFQLAMIWPDSGQEQITLELSREDLDGPTAQLTEIAVVEQ